MNTAMANDLTRLVFESDTVSMSPREVQQLNAKPLQPFRPLNAPNIGTPAGFQVLMTGYAQAVFDREKNASAKLGLGRALERLRALPRSLTDGFKKKGSVDTWAIKTEHYSIQYRVYSGQVVVYNIGLLDQEQERRNRRERPGLYVIRKDGQGIWRAEMNPVPAVRTRHAAVNGMLNNLSKATWLMGEHLEHAYGGTSGVNEYTLFHNPTESAMSDLWESVRDKLGMSTKLASKLERILDEAQKHGSEVNWVVHSQGSLIFSEAVRIHLNGRGSVFTNFNGAFGKAKGRQLDRHRVALHGNASNHWRSNMLFKRAGIEVVGYNSHPYDLVNAVIGLNTASPRRIIGSLVYAGHVTGGTMQQSPHTLPYKGMDNWNKAMESGPGKGRNTAQRAFKAVENYLP